MQALKKAKARLKKLLSSSRNEKTDFAISLEKTTIRLLEQRAKTISEARVNIQESRDSRMRARENIEISLQRIEASRAILANTEKLLGKKIA